MKTTKAYEILENAGWYIVNTHNSNETAMRVIVTAMNQVFAELTITALNAILEKEKTISIKEDMLNGRR